MTFPQHAMTMIGRRRLDNIRHCVEQVIAGDVPGDLIETGVWRGGATIYMRAILQAWGVTERKVWAADSFEGLPPSDLKNYPQDKDAAPYTEYHWVFSVDLDSVKANFESLGMLDDQVVSLEGWSRTRCPKADRAEVVDPQARRGPLLVNN